MKRWLTLAVLAWVLISVISCVESESPQPLTGEEEERVKAALIDRSFRQFEPSLDASPRKGIVLDFFDGMSVWAQYAEDGHAVNEWEITAKDYRIEKHGEVSEVTIFPIDPRAVQAFPTKCEDCIEPSGFSISIRNVFDSESISFKLSDPDGALPAPFPVFDSWTKFREDEIME